MEHTNQIARCMTRPCIDPTLLSGSCPQSTRSKVPDNRRNLEPWFHQPIQHRQLVRRTLFPTCRCVAVAPLSVDIIEMFPSSSECAFRNIIVVDASCIPALEFHAMVSVRDTQCADVPVPLRCRAQREIPIARTTQQQHKESVPCHAGRS